MSRFYNADACRRKANQHWEMAGCARMDRDEEDAFSHTQQAQVWTERARDGGYNDIGGSEMRKANCCDCECHTGGAVMHAFACCEPDAPGSILAAAIDLDNCISDDGWRHKLWELHHEIPGDRYHRYHAACNRDTLHNADILRELAAKYSIVIFTARPEAVRRKTELWLKKWGVPYVELIMRGDHEHTPSVALKRTFLLERLPRAYKVEFAMDDRVDILDMYADEGVPIVRHVSINPMENIHP